ncbi:MAG: TPM domain-containing protein [Smithella sp.]|nr:TPM domain-containing protein [Smithella sp.]
MKKHLYFIIVLSIFYAGFDVLAVDVPYLTGRVTDHADILAPETRKIISEKLKSHEERTGNQIAVLTVPSLQGEGIEEYAVAVFQEWKLGQKGKDNGILLVVAPVERRLRIEVGYGLEGTIPDGLAGRIIRDVISPKFKAGDYNGGIDAGVQAIIRVLEGGSVPPERVISGESKKSQGVFLETPDMTIMERILLGAFIFGIIGLFTVLGMMTPGGGGWFLYFFLIPFWSMFPIVVLGTTGAFYLFVIYLIGFPLAKFLFRNSEWYKKAVKEMQKGQAGIGGFPVGGGQGGSWSSGSSSGSGFSGGGGSSGGGGASGSW